MKRKIIIIIAALVAAFFISVNFMYQPNGKFYNKTTVNNIDVSNLTIREAEKKLSEEWNKAFTFQYKGESYEVPLNLNYDISNQLSRINPSYKEKLRYLFGRGNNYKIKMKTEGTDELLKNIAELKLCDNSEREKTQNAYIDLSDFNFRIQPEKIGTEIDPLRVEQVALENIENGVFQTELKDEEIIKQPEITKDSEEIKKQQKYYKDNFNYQLEYNIDGKTFILSPKELSGLVSYEGETKIKKKKVKAFVEDLASEYNEYHKTYNFRTSYGSYVDVYAVTFGRIVNQDEEVEYLTNALKEQKSDTHTLNWSQNKYEESSAGIGNSYIEVSISGQHVWCYKDGECVVSSDCVTGKPGHDTVKGLYTIQYVTGPMTLKGENDDGTKYASKVNCFMPFYDGQGFHGSNNWRSSWGGKIYKTNGSHGCVNLPDAAAKTIANTVDSGYPVVIY